MYNPNYIEWGSPQGWRCPGCGRYYSPSTPMCFYCGGDQKTWTSPTTTGMPPNWDDYLKQTTTGKGTFDNYSVTTAEVRTGTDQATATVTSNPNVKVTAWNSSTTCGQDCESCDKYEKSCFGRIETTPNSITSHRKPLKTILTNETTINNFIKNIQTKSR